MLTLVVWLNQVRSLKCGSIHVESISFSSPTT